MPIAKARERGRGIRPRILMNGQAAAYSSFRRIRGIVTVSLGKITCQTAERKLNYARQFVEPGSIGFLRLPTRRAIRSHASQIPLAAPPESDLSWRGCPESANRHSTS